MREGLESCAERLRVGDQAIDERRRRDHARGFVGPNLAKERRRFDLTGTPQVGVGDHAGRAGGEIGENEHWQRRQVYFAGAQGEVVGNDVVLREQKPVRSHGALWLTSAAACEGEEGGGIWSGGGDG